MGIAANPERAGVLDVGTARRLVEADMRRVSTFVLSVGSAAVVACGGGSSPGSASTAPSSSEVATSVVSGAISNSAGSALGWNGPRAPGVPALRRLLDELNPVAKAYAAAWSCTGGTLAPPFAGPGTYQFTPVSCSVTWENGRSASSQWSGAFTLQYGAGCDATHARIVNQAAGCALTRTTAAGGDARTITGPNGNAYAITHDTHGAGTGWDAGVSPAPTDAGVVVTCGAGGCPASGGTLAVNGSHLTGTVTPSGGSPTVIWDHTVSTAAGPLAFTVSGVTRVFSGAVTVQHNLARFTAVSTFDGVGFVAGCCYPTSGSVTTTFLNGPFVGDTETLTFSSSCGETSLKDASGKIAPLTLEHCL